MQTDNGKEFVNKHIRELCEEFAIIHVRGRPRHPQNQGQAERANQTLVRKLSKALFKIEEERWVVALDEIVYKYNTRIHRATNRTPLSIFRRHQWRREPGVLIAAEDYGAENKCTEQA